MMLECKDISFKYATKSILQDVSFGVKKGEILSLLGPNGTGKTTLLKCINNILKPSSGTAFLGHENICNMKPKQIAKYIGYVPQYTSLNFPINVIDTIMMGRVPFARGHIRKVDKDVVFEIIKMMNLEEYAFKDINDMSGGQRQRVLIARALAQEPKVLILDEPTSSLDMKNQLFILNIIKKLAKEKELAVIMSIHDLNLASMFSDKILMLNNSKVFAYGTCDEVINENNIQSLYNVKTCVTSEDDLKHVRLLNNICI